MVTETSQTSQTISTVSGASVYLGGYGMRSGPGSLTLDPGFIANIEPLVNAAAKNKYDAVSGRGCTSRQAGTQAPVAGARAGALPQPEPWLFLLRSPLSGLAELTHISPPHPVDTWRLQIMLKSLINNYGTHYIRSVWYGGVGERRPGSARAACWA